MDFLLGTLGFRIAVAVSVGCYRHLDKKHERETELAVAVQNAKTKEELLELADQIESISSSTARHIRSKKYLKERGFE